MRTQPQPDDVLEREIEALLAVDHSPEFCAKVRATLAESPVPTRWRFGWRLLPVAAAVAATAVLVLRWPAGEPVAPLTAALVRAPQAAAMSDVPVAPIAPPAAAAPERVAAVRPVVTPRAPGRTAQAASDVIVSPDEARAFRLLLAAIQEDRLPEFVASDGADATATGPGLPTPEAIRITAVVIEAIAPFTPIEIAGELQ